ISWVLGEQSAKTLRGSRMEDVIFAGTRDRKPTGMAEVTLTLINPEEYGGPDDNEPTEIEVQDDMPPGSEDWDEAEIRAKRAQETEEAVEEAQPGKTEEVEVTSAGNAAHVSEQDSAALEPSASQSQNSAESSDSISGVDRESNAHSNGSRDIANSGANGSGAAAVAGP